MLNHYSRLTSLGWCLLLWTPALVLAQNQETSTQRRIRLGPDPVNTNENRWSDWHNAGADEFTWTPPHAFWRGFIKTSNQGQKAGIFVAIFFAPNNQSRESFNGSAASSFAEDGAYQTGITQFDLSGHEADNLIFSAGAGDGLYFSGGHTPTSVSVVHVKLEKEKDTRYYPFLVFYMACPASVFDQVEPEFEQFVQATYIQPLYGSIAGRVMAKDSGPAIGGATVQLLDSKTSKTVTKVSDSTGAYRFDSLLASNYYLTVSDAPGFKSLSLPSIVALNSGQDTTGVELALERAEPSAAKSKQKKAISWPVITDYQPGIGYRHRWNDGGALAVNARSGKLVAELDLGLSLDDNLNFYSIVPELGAQYLLRKSDKLNIGLGATAAFRISNNPSCEAGLQALEVGVPLTVEYFLPGDLAVQASAGLYLTVQAGRVRSLGIGPSNPSLGFTWYPK